MTADICACGCQITNVTPNNRIFVGQGRNSSSLTRKPPTRWITYTTKNERTLSTLTFHIQSFSYSKESVKWLTKIVRTNHRTTLWNIFSESVEFSLTNEMSVFTANKFSLPCWERWPLITFHGHVYSFTWHWKSNKTRFPASKSFVKYVVTFFLTTCEPHPHRQGEHTSTENNHV